MQISSSFAVSPREGISAGLTSPGQCLHDSFGVRRRISSTRSPTSCFHARSFFIQHKVVIESVHKATGISVPRDFNLLTRRAKIRAPNNSKRGIVSLDRCHSCFRSDQPNLDCERRPRRKHVQMHRKNHVFVHLWVGGKSNNEEFDNNRSVFLLSVHCPNLFCLCTLPA